MPVLTIDQPDTHPRREWTISNGLGGFAQGTPTGIPLRRYHAWLIAALSPPVGRVVALHSCVEAIYVDSVRHELSCYRFNGGGLSPLATPACRNFEFDYVSARWRLEVPTGGGSSNNNALRPGAFVDRTLSLSRGENSATVTYNIPAVASHNAVFHVRPLVPLRDFHSLCRQSQEFNYITDAGPISVHVSNSSASSLLICSAADINGQTLNITFEKAQEWWRNFEYTKDQERSDASPEEGREDLPSPGYFAVKLPFGLASTITLTCTASRGENVPSTTLPALDTAARVNFTQPDDRELSYLHAAADQFVVRREHASGTGSTIIAGYPWFSDWGRDTCISLPGLLISTGRLIEARQALEAFASMMEGGLVPNCFDNGSGAAEYNTADASLWYLNAACELALAMRVDLDPSGELAQIADACLQIIRAYERGTAFDIRMDSADGLIIAGNSGTQLTWMDAKRNGVVFTPRHGKPVELSCLWYNGLKRVSELLPAAQARTKRELLDIASWSDRSFEKAFWNESRSCLYDCLTPVYADVYGAPRSLDDCGTYISSWQASSLLRPNQIFAVSLPYSPLDTSLQQRVLDTVTEHLLTPVGLRTLAQGEPGFEPRFEGVIFARDRAYHNGTVWPWLLGPYCEAVLRLGKFSQESRERARAAMAPLLTSLVDPSLTFAHDTQFNNGPIGSIAEIFDATAPHRPDGCPAQAWSVAELLRVRTLLAS